MYILILYLYIFNNGYLILDFIIVDYIIFDYEIMVER